MTFTLYVDEDRWRRHLASVVDATPGIVPVIKGNGYGFGNARLAAEAARLGVPAVAVGTSDELPAVREHFDGDVLVMSPSHPRCEDDPTGRVVRTVAHLETLRAGGGARVVVEGMTTMRRHGLPADAVTSVAGLLGDVRLDGLAFHLPMDRHGGYDPAAEVAGWLERFAAAGVPTDVAWVSHLTTAELAGLRTRFASTTFRPRIGTALWLGDRDALVAKGTVLDVHPLARGEHYGYRRRRAVRDAHLVVVSGGTAHGVALEAPRTVRGPVGRGKALAVGGLAAANRALSPFTWAGHRRWFAEPPHMHVSLLLLPASVTPPAIGDELVCDVRLTTLHPDRVAPAAVK
jgi:hypothetical protein